jgi:spore germination protein YaaH
MTLKGLNYRAFNYGKAWRIVTALLVLVLVGEAAGIPFAMKVPTSQQYVDEAAKRSAALQPMPKTEVSAWLAWYNEGQAYDSMAHHTSDMNMVMPVWYKISSRGKVELINGVTRKEEILKVANKNHLKVMPTIGNDFDAERISKLLNDEDGQNAVIAELVSQAQRNGYAGWDVDWEQLYPGDRDGMNDFIQNLASALHEHGLKLTIDVPVPSTRNNDSDQDKAFDYTKLSQYADEIRVMAYDYHYQESDPGAVTPLGDYQATVKSVASQIPAAKLVIGLPTYGYDWDLKTRSGSPVQYSEAMALIKTYHGSIKRDKHTAAQVGRYKVDGVEHVIWYNDAQSTKDQVAIARSYGVYKFALWRLGGEDTAMWSAF